MDFQLSKSQKEIQKAAREFAKGEFDKDLANEQEKLGVFPEKIRPSRTSVRLRREISRTLQCLI